MTKDIAVIGGSGAIGMEFTKQLAICNPQANIYSFSRQPIEQPIINVHSHIIDYHDERSIDNASNILDNKKIGDKRWDMVIVATGLLHDDNIKPEKSLNDLSASKFQTLFEVNTIVPAMIAKYFIPKLNKNSRSVFTALSARVGSISDNRLGGWYAYRASKAALNMVIKNVAIETRLRNKNAIVVGLHPGTVESHLSSPFVKNVSEEKLFTSTYSVSKMIEVLNALSLSQSGKCFAWDGKQIEP